MVSSYSGVVDLLLGDMPVALAVNKQKYVDDAADEIDSIIGARYTTPIDVSDTSDVPRYARLFLKRAANHLATGRLILALAAGGEDQALHAYGYSLVQNALVALQQIAQGEYNLPGAMTTGGTEAAPVRVTAPTIAQEDSTSGVAALYDAFRPAKYPLVIDPRYLDPARRPHWVPGDQHDDQ